MDVNFDPVMTVVLVSNKQASVAFAVAPTDDSRKAFDILPHLDLLVAA